MNEREKIPMRQHISNVRKLLGFVRDMDAHYFHISCVVHLINVIVPNMMLLLSAYILDGIGSGKSYREIMTVTVAVIAVALALNFVASTVWNRLEVRREVIFWKYDSSIYVKMLEMDFSLLDSPEIRELKDRIFRDTNWGCGLNNVLWDINSILYGLFDIVSAVLVGAPVVGYLLYSGEWRALVVLGVMICIVLALKKSQKWFNKKRHDYMFRMLRDEEKEEAATLVWDYAMGGLYYYGNGKDIRIYGSYDLMKRWTIDPLWGKARRKTERDGAVGMAGFYSTDEFGHALLEGGAYLIVTMIALAGAVGIGSLIRLAGALGRLFSAVYQLFGSSLADLVERAKMQASTIEFLEVRDEMYKGKLPLEKRSDNQYQIEFRHVSFKYPGTDQYALKDFSMKLNIGEKLAIVGMNGSGKTTMIKLLCRLYDPDEGEILLNGVDIRKFKHEEYSRLFSVVFQDYVLFHFMLAENVATDVEYDRDRVIKCLEDAGFGGRLRELEKGVETYIQKDYEESGVEISGGEAQKIAIARAIYKEAPFVLLDEPTAALDPLAEYEIYSNFDRIIGTKTAVYISHRLSSCRFCEKIAVFHEGRLVQMGDHDTLVADREGKYYEMWSAQAQYYQ